MGGMKTILGAVLLTLPVGAMAQDDTPLRDMFAQCAGRFSAEMEHAWLIDSAKADDHRARRLDFLDLLAAIAPRDQQRSILHTRIETKVAHASLLTIATFIDEPARSDAARSAAQMHLNTCRKLLLKG